MSLDSNLASNLASDLANDLSGGRLSITSLGTASGTDAGGTTVQINGSGFTGVSGAAGVKFGGVNAASYVVVNDARIDAVTPKIFSGVAFVGRATLALSSTASDNTVNVTVTKGGVTTTLAGGFTYISELARIFTTDLVWEGRASDPRIVLNSGNVSSLPDFTNNGAAIQGTASKQPAWSATSQHGGPGFTGDGVDDGLVATFSTPLASGVRYYLVFGSRFVAATGSNWTGISDNANGQYIAGQRSGAAFHNARADSSTPGENSAGPAEDLNYHRFELGFTNGGSGFVVDGTGFTFATATGTPNANLVKLELCQLFGASNSNVRFTDVAIIKRIPTGPELTAMRAYFSGANFPGYTGGTYQ